ncbi:MAG TPA: hypothetical protein VFC99_05790 [Acidimicrobiia bacterium]|nr:hypothetical protein [Acidimicrobiia bacterium]
MRTTRHGGSTLTRCCPAGQRPIELRLGVALRRYLWCEAHRDEIARKVAADVIRWSDNLSRLSFSYPQLTFPTMEGANE